MTDAPALPPEAAPQRPSKAPMIVVIIIVVAVALLLVCGVLAALLLPAMAQATRNAKVAMCANNLKQLHTMQASYAQQFGGRARLMPSETGGEFWLALSRTTPPLIDASVSDIYRCPFHNVPPRWDVTDYRGPSTDANQYGDGDPLGADRVGLHGDGGNVLQKSGAVLHCPATDPLWAAAATKTRP